MTVFPGQGDDGACPVPEGFDLAQAPEAFRLPFPLNPPQGPLVLAATYIGADGQPRSSFDPRNADKPVKLGYDDTLQRSFPPGYIYHGTKSWHAAGLVPLDKTSFWPMFYEAIKNTRTVNFAIDGMNINDPASLQIDRITHQELDAIIQGGYLEKLHLWDGRTELTGQRLNQWIDQWIDIRGL
jgi:hypothetical protein